MTNESKSSVTISHVGGNIGNVAGRDQISNEITINGRQVPSNAPTIDLFRELMEEIERDLAEIIAQKDALAKISPASLPRAQSAELDLKDQVDKVKKNTKIDKVEANNLQKRLEGIKGTLNTILDDAKDLSKKAGDTAASIEPLVKSLAPLASKVGVAVAWVAKLWLV